LIIAFRSDPAELKTLLRPVFDFDAKSAIESYLETVPPIVKEAIQKHQVLVGMKREMVSTLRVGRKRRFVRRTARSNTRSGFTASRRRMLSLLRLLGDEVVQMKT